jgi:hypothetical protein
VFLEMLMPASLGAALAAPQSGRRGGAFLRPASGAGFTKAIVGKFSLASGQ